jgi:hypothetical protein
MESKYTDVFDKILQEIPTIIERIEDVIQNTHYPNEHRSPLYHHRPIGIGVKELEEWFNQLKLKER